MASSWKKVKSMFWQPSGGATAHPEGAPPAEAPGEEMSDADFATFLSGNEHVVSKDAYEPVEPASVAVKADVFGSTTIDFQAQYDAAGIPDTDEVEQLENFLSRLDGSLPKASKIAAAQAFLGAVGKDKGSVLEDAERKIKRVHGILRGKEDETRDALAREQQEIDALQAKVEAHRKHMEELNRALEGVRQACLGEESRLQAARVFFGAFDAPGGASPAPARGAASRQQ
jgi:hypothetical protein